MVNDLEKQGFIGEHLNYPKNMQEVAYVVPPTQISIERLFSGHRSIYV